MSRPWKDVEDELSAEDVKTLHAETGAEVLSPEFRSKVLAKMSSGQTLQKKGLGLFVLGPSASGKSHSLRQGVADTPQGAITLDGAYIRDCSQVWKQTLEKAESRGLAGFSDYFQNYFKGPCDKLKHSIVDYAIQEKANVVVPDTASTVQNSLDTVDRLLDAGYQLKFIAVYAAKHICEERGKSREGVEGKKFSSKNWEASVQSILTIQEHLVSRGVVGQTGNVRIFDNSEESLREVDFDTVRELLGDESSTGGGTKQASWCETRLLAGIYSGANDRVEIIPANFEDEVVDVKMVGADGVPRAMKFDVTTCKCDNGFELSIDTRGKPVLSSSQGMLECVESIPGLSLTHSLESIAHVLQGRNFLGPNASFRTLLDEEFQGASESCRVSGAQAAPTRKQPSAVFVVAPSGGGKTTCLKNYMHKFGFKLEESVVADSAMFRDYHVQYDQVIKNGLANGGIWYSAWPSVKKVVSNAKKQIIDLAIKAKQDLCISDTGSDTSKLLELIEKLKSAGYKVHMLGIFAEPQEIITRGVAREMQEGKRYNRDVQKLCQTFDAFAPGIQSINGTFCLVLNAQGKDPQLYQQENGGIQLTFNLQEALGSAQRPSAKPVSQKGSKAVRDDQIVSSAKVSKGPRAFARTDDERRQQLDDIAGILETQADQLKSIRQDHSEQIQGLRTRHEAICKCLDSVGLHASRTSKKKAKARQSPPDATQKRGGSFKTSTMKQEVSSAAVPGELSGTWGEEPPSSSSTVPKSSSASRSRRSVEFDLTQQAASQGNGKESLDLSNLATQPSEVGQSQEDGRESVDLSNLGPRLSEVGPLDASLDDILGLDDTFAGEL